MDIHLFSPYIRVAMYSELAPNFIINTRILYDYEIIYVSSGKCNITFHEKTYLCQKGDVVFIPPDTPHKFECFSDCSFIQPHIHFDPIYSPESEKRTVSFKNKNGMTEKELALVQEDILAPLAVPYVFVPLDKQRFQSVFFEIVELFQAKRENYALLCKAKTLELLALLFAQFGNKTPIKNFTETAYCIHSVKQYIDNNFQEIITLDGLAKQFYINKFTLIRAFQTAYKTSVMAYYKNQRLTFAKQRLTKTEMSVTAISEALHFADIFTFSRFFKQQTGLSPQAYRQANART